MGRLLAFLAIAFKAWMLVDAVRRQAETKWLWIIALVPFGAWAYFFIVKLREPGMRQLQQRMLESLKRPPAVDELRYALERSPSQANRIRLAQGLYDAGQWSEAHELFVALLEEQPGHRDGLYGLGLCRIELGDLPGAIEPLAELVEQHRRYRDYAAWPPLAQAHLELGQIDECMVLVDELVKTAPRLAHELLRARILDQVGRRAEAEAALEAALKEHDHSPRAQRRRDWLTARQAKALLRDWQGGA